jgi:hypothetical protein
MGQESKSTGYWRVNNSPTITRVAKRQQTKQKSKCQLAAQGYNKLKYEALNLSKLTLNRIHFVMNGGLNVFSNEFLSVLNLV